MGVPVREDGRDNESRYRVDPKEYYLPDLELSDEELAALHVAVTGISLGAGGGEGAGALMKLGGLEGTGGTPGGRAAAGRHAGPALRRLPPPLRRRDHLPRPGPAGSSRGASPRSSGTGTSWARTSASGEMRVFRADRIDGDVVATEPDAFTVPDDFRADAYLADQPWEYGSGRAMRVRIRIDADHVAELAGQVGPDIPIEREADGSVVIELPVVNLDGLRSFVLGFLDHAEVLSPPEARAAVTDWLDEIIAAGASMSWS